MLTRRVVTSVHKNAVFAIVGRLVAVGLAAAVIVGFAAPSPADAYKGNAIVQIKTSVLERRMNGDCYITITWDKNAGRPKYYMLEWEYPAGGGLPNPPTIQPPQRLTAKEIRPGELKIGPLRSADIARCRVSLSPGIHGKKAVWVPSQFME